MFGRNKATGKEIILVDKDKFTFKGNFGLLEALESSGFNAISLYTKLSQEKAEFSDVISVLKVGIETKNGKPIIDAEKECEILIDRKGYSQVYSLATILLSYAMVGGEQVKKLEAIQNMMALMEQVSATHSKSLRKLGLSLVIQLMISTSLLWLILKLVGLFIS